MGMLRTTLDSVTSSPIRLESQTHMDGPLGPGSFNQLLFQSE